MIKDSILKSISAENKSTDTISSVSFEKGVTVLHGPSNRGKSLMIQIAADAILQKSSTGIKNISLCSVTILDTATKKTCELTTRSKKTKCGITDILEIPAPSERIQEPQEDTKYIDSKILNQMLILDGSRMLSLNTASLLSENADAVRSLIYYLYTGTVSSGKTSRTDTKAELTKEQYSLETRKSSIEKKLRKYGILDNCPLSDTIDTEILNIETNISKMEAKLAKKLDQKNLLMEQLAKARSELEALHTFMANQENLMSQYEADIKRLEFIANGRNAIGDTDTMHATCPICGSVITADNSGIDASALEKELHCIIQKVLMLKSDIQRTESSEDELQTLISEKESRLEEIEDDLKEALSPKLKYFTAIRKNLGRKLAQKGRISELQDQLENINSKIEKNKKALESHKKNDTLSSSIKAPNKFSKDVNAEIRRILEAAYFPYTSIAYFDEDSFEIKIQGMEHIGGGWTAYMKTVLFISLRNVINRQGHFYLPFALIDSPFIGLSNEKNSLEMKMKNGLLEFLSVHAEEIGQLILIEKTANLPDLSEFDMINDIHFGDDAEALRKGFLVDNYDLLNFD